MFDFAFVHMMKKRSVLIIVHLGLEGQQLRHSLLLESLCVGEPHPQLLVLGLEELRPDVNLLLFGTSSVTTALRSRVVLPSSLPVLVVFGVAW